MTQSDCINDDSALHAQLARFQVHTPKELAATAAISPRIAQLAFSFPLLFTQIADRYGPPQERNAAIRLTTDGARLSRVAAAMGLPLCLRHLPPEACGNGVSHFMWSPSASRLLASLIPADPSFARNWIAGISFAARYGDEAIAIWIARQHRLFALGRFEAYSLMPLILYAWHSRYRPDVLLFSVPWIPSLELPEAFFRTVAWLKMIKPHVDLDYWGVCDSWMPPADWKGYFFIPLSTPNALTVDAIEMQNCISEYGEGIARNFCRLFSVRRAGQKIATMEIRPCDVSRHPVIVDMKGPNNSECSVEVWHAAEQFVKQHARPVVDQIAPPNIGASHRLKGMLLHYCAAHPEEMREWVRAMPFWHLQRSTMALGRAIGEKALWKHWKQRADRRPQKCTLLFGSPPRGDHGLDPGFAR